MCFPPLLPQPQRSGTTPRRSSLQEPCSSGAGNGNSRSCHLYSRRQPCRCSLGTATPRNPAFDPAVPPLSASWEGSSAFPALLPLRPHLASPPAFSSISQSPALLPPALLPWRESLPSQQQPREPRTVFPDICPTCPHVSVRNHQTLPHLILFTPLRLPGGDGPVGTCAIPRLPGPPLPCSAGAGVCTGAAESILKAGRPKTRRFSEITHVASYRRFSVSELC